MPDPMFDYEEQYRKVEAGKLPGEQVFAVLDAKGAGTGFMGLTSHRLIIQDDSFVGGKSAVISIPYSRVSSVSFVSDKSMFGKFVASSSISVQVGSSAFTMQFRGDDKAKYAHDFILNQILKG